MLDVQEMTSVFRNLDSELMRPDENQWVRIKSSGPYEQDFGIINKYVDDKKIFVKLIPRINP